MTESFDDIAEMMAQKAKIAASEGKTKRKLKDTIKIICESDSDLFLEFTSRFPRKLRKKYYATLRGYGTVKDENGNNRPMTDDEIDAHDERIISEQNQILRKVLVDGYLTYDGGESLDGADAILNCDPDDMDSVSFDFFAGAFLEAMSKLGELGNARKVS